MKITRCEYSHYYDAEKHSICPYCQKDGVQNRLLMKKRKYQEIQIIIGYRYSVTGIFGYDYYEGNNKICGISSIVMPNSSVSIYGNGNRWVSDFEDCTIYPGLSREVRDTKSDRQIAKIVYKDTGEYEINDTVYVYCGTDKYSFVRN